MTETQRRWFQERKVPCGCGNLKTPESANCAACASKLRRRYNKSINKQGYVVIGGYREHPNSDRQGKIKEHTLVMSTHLGRALLPHEEVHHKNGNRSDNRISNLELWSTSQPKGQRVEDKLEWAREIINLYGGNES